MPCGVLRPARVSIAEEPAYPEVLHISGGSGRALATVWSRRRVVCLHARRHEMRLLLQHREPLLCLQRHIARVVGRQWIHVAHHVA